MTNKEGNPRGASGEDIGAETESVLENMGEFNREAAEQARADYVREHPDQPDESTEDTPEDVAREIDYSCFDRLSAEDFGALPEEQRQEIVKQCEAALDASIEEFAKLGSFSDPELGRYNGDVYHEGMDGAKRGVSHIVNCAIKAEKLQSEIAAAEAELAKYTGVYAFFHRKQKAQLESRLAQLRQSHKDNVDWVEHIGGMAFQDPVEKQKYKEKTKGADIVGGMGSERYVQKQREEGKKAFTSEEVRELERPVIESSLAVFHSEAVQSKFQHLIQMRKACNNARAQRI